MVALLINQSWGRPHFLSEARSAVRPLLCTKNKSVLNLAGLGSLFGRGSAPQQEMACPRNAGFFCGIVASLFAVPIQCKPTASAPWFLYPPVKARALVPQQAPEQAPTRFDVPAYDQERANQNHKATAQLIPLDLEHPVLDHFASLHAELNVFMWGDSSIVHQFFLLRGLTGGLPSLTPPLYRIAVSSPFTVPSAALCPTVDVHVHKAAYGNATISVTAAVCTTGLVTVAMAPAVLEELQQKHGLSLPVNSLLYIGGAGLHHMHIDDFRNADCARDWAALKPLEDGFEDNLMYGLTELQKRYPDAKLAYFNTHSVCTSNLWLPFPAQAGARVRASACESRDWKACFLGVDVPPEERDSYRETLFSHLGSNVMADRERAVLKDPSLKWKLVDGHKITKDASCEQSEDGIHYLEPTMMKMIEEALSVLRKSGKPD